MKDKDKRGSISIPKLRRLLIRTVHVANKRHKCGYYPWLSDPFKPWIQRATQKYIYLARKTMTLCWV